MTRIMSPGSIISITWDSGFNSSGKALLPLFQKLTDDERHRAMFSLVPPTLGLAVTPESVIYLIVNPKAPEVIDLHIGYCLDPRAPKEPLFDLLFRDMETGVNDFKRPGYSCEYDGAEGSAFTLRSPWPLFLAGRPVATIQSLAGETLSRPLAVNPS